MKYFDKKNNRLICPGDQSTTFWDGQWNVVQFARTVRESGERNSFVTAYTLKYLGAGSRILEGGCGIGHYVYALNRVGFDAYGIDNAPIVISKINLSFPDLKITNADVRNTNFDKDFFDGYWSLGVIEHFYHGYNEVLGEMNRIIRPGGYLFVTFPTMNYLRKLKTRLGLYKDFQGVDMKNDFYQFILDEDQVIKDLEDHGFELVERKKLDAVKGLQDEMSLPPIIYNSKFLPIKIVRYAINRILARLFGHITLLILKKS